MSRKKTYETFREARSNAGAISRMLDIFRATEPGIIIETPEQAETINEIVAFSVSEDARNIGPRWMGVRPEVVVTTFTEYPQEYRLVKASKNTKSNGSVSITYTEPVEGDGDWDGVNGKALPYGDPIDCPDDVLEPIPKSKANKNLGASMQTKFMTKSSPDKICMTLLKSIYDFDSQKRTRKNLCRQVFEKLLDFQNILCRLQNELTFSETRLVVTGLGIVLLVPPHFASDIPDELKESLFHIKWNRPHKTYWRETIRSYVHDKPMYMDTDESGNPIVGISDNELERCVSAVTGMTKARGESALLMCVPKFGKIDVPNPSLTKNHSRSQATVLSCTIPTLTIWSVVCKFSRSISKRKLHVQLPKHSIWSTRKSYGYPRSWTTRYR